MDPDEALRRIRQALEDVQLAQPHDLDLAANDLANAVTALDQWLSSGGFLPDAWRRS